MSMVLIDTSHSRLLPRDFDIHQRRVLLASMVIAVEQVALEDGTSVLTADKTCELSQRGHNHHLLHNGLSVHIHMFDREHLGGVGRLDHMIDAESIDRAAFKISR
jgi:hypothetical protein